MNYVTLGQESTLGDTKGSLHKRQWIRVNAQEGMVRLRVLSPFNVRS